MIINEQTYDNIDRKKLDEYKNKKIIITKKEVSKINKFHIKDKQYYFKVEEL